MGRYLLNRFFYTLILLVLVSVVSFVIIQLPPGDFVTHYEVASAGVFVVPQEEIEAMRARYGLDRPVFVQYFHWIADFLTGDMGFSLTYQKPVRRLIGERLALTATVSFLSILFAYALAIPIGVYGATHQYKIGDYVATVIGFIGLAIPNFLLALILMLFAARNFGMSVGGLISPEFVFEPWTFAKVVDLLRHLPIPMIVVGTASTAGLIRVMRSGLLDELNKLYVVTARTRGLSRRRVIFKYPVRVALNPIVSTVGWVLPAIISGETITAIVLSLPTVGPLLFEALIAEDMYLAGGILMVLSMFTVIGTFVSDMLLAWLDPRIRIQKKMAR